MHKNAYAHIWLHFFHFFWFLSFFPLVPPLETVKKKELLIFFPKKQRIYDYFSEFASEALHIVIFENFVKSMMSC